MTKDGNEGEVAVFEHAELPQHSLSFTLTWLKKSQLQVFSELTSLVSKLSREDGKYPNALLTSLKGVRRFPNGYKSLAPYNVLSLLDPRYYFCNQNGIILCNNLFRYMDIYFSTEEIKKAIDDLAMDDVYDSVPASQTWQQQQFLS